MAPKSPPRAINERHSQSSHEARPLLRSFPNPSRYGSFRFRETIKENVSSWNRVRDRLTADVDTRWTDLILIICFFTSGLIDAGAYNAYECFVSMQTGNTVFAALGVSDLPVSQPSLSWTKSVCAILCFLLGSFTTATFHRYFGERKRWVLTTSFSFQAFLTLISATLVQRGHSSGSPGFLSLPADPGFPWQDLLPIGLLSFQAAGKIVTSRALQFNALPVVVLTTLYSDLISDPSLFSAGLFDNAQRNRRAGGAGVYFLGAVLGGVCASHSFGFSGALGLATAIQFCLAAAWLFWREQTDEEDAAEA